MVGPHLPMIVAITKTFRGEEFCEASLESVYNHVDAIVYAHSDIDWVGKRGNTVAQKIEEWKKKNDNKNKIVNLYYDCGNQTEQYNYLWKYVDENYPDHQWKMMLDTDEVWDDASWAEAMRYMQNTQKVNCYTCQMRTYIKSPFFRIYPIDACHPVIFVRAGLPYTGVRCSGIIPRFEMQGVTMHHFSAVRRNVHLVYDKHAVSSHVENEPILDKKQWIESKWNQLPGAKNIHPNTMYANTWAGVDVVDLNALPPAARSKPFVQAFLNYKFLPRISSMPEQFNAYGLPDGFGPGHPDWNTPSKRNKYNLMMEGKSVTGEVSKMPAIPPAPVQQFNDQKEAAEKLPPSKRNKKYAGIPNNGNMCVVTMVSGIYQWYIPLFVDRMKKEYPEYGVKVLLRGKKLLPDKYMDSVTVIKTTGFKEDGYTTAALRYVWDYPDIDKYDYCLISDIDMLHRRERPTIVDSRMLDLRAYKLDCYSNYVSSIYEGKPRMPGIHFVTKDWWKKTKKSRSTQLALLKNNGATCWAHDEVMIAQIVKDSGLPVQEEEQKLWQMHGLHLGDIRRQIEKNEPIRQFGADDQVYMRKLIEDDSFMYLVGKCAEHIPTLEATFNIYRKQFV